MDIVKLFRREFIDYRQKYIPRWKPFYQLFTVRHKLCTLELGYPTSYTMYW